MLFHHILLIFEKKNDRHYFLKNTLEQRLELYHQDFEGLIIDNYNPEQGILERCDDAGPGANGKLAFKVTPPGAN